MYLAQTLRVAASGRDENRTKGRNPAQFRRRTRMNRRGVSAKHAGVPHVRDLEARDELDRFKPVARVSPEMVVSVWPALIAPAGRVNDSVAPA
jgi:hypothetical protein